MAKHSEVEKGKLSLVTALRTALSDGSLPAGQKLPSLRLLAREHGVSTTVAWECIGQLLDEGLVHSRPRLGVFAGKQTQAKNVYLLVFNIEPLSNSFWEHLQLGFEERIAHLGGLSLRLTVEEAQSALERGQLPALAGVFDMAGWNRRPDWIPSGIPLVKVGKLGVSEGEGDRVHFDDFDGGKQAVRYLLSLGHNRIAYLGVHCSGEETAGPYWSVDREAGWNLAMRSAGCNVDGLSLLDNFPSSRTDCEKLPAGEQFARAQRAASRLMKPGDITAVVTANLIAAEALYAVLSEAKLKEDEWPAILSFDDVPLGARSVVSYLRLPWDEVGRTGAQLLWERQTGRLSGEARERLVPMRLIPRLSCGPHHGSWMGRGLALPTAREESLSWANPKL